VVNGVWIDRVSVCRSSCLRLAARSMPSASSTPFGNCALGDQTHECSQFRTEFAADSSREEAGFELSVPLKDEWRLKARYSDAAARLCRREAALIRQSQVGTEGSKPVSSSGESVSPAENGLRAKFMLDVQRVANNTG
jgi:hypothetical protein